CRGRAGLARRAADEAGAGRRPGRAERGRAPREGGVRQPPLYLQVAAVLPRVRSRGRHEGRRSRLPRASDGLHAGRDDCVRRRRERRRARRVGGLRHRGRECAGAREGGRRLDRRGREGGRRRGGARGASRLEAMIDLRAARNDPAATRAALERRGAGEAFDELLAADERWRALVPHVDELRARQKLDGKPTPVQLAQLRELKEQLGVAEERLSAAEAVRDAALAKVPNVPDPSAADGFRDEDAIVVKTWGEPSTEPAPEHLELANYDMERGAKVSGARFGFI